MITLMLMCDLHGWVWATLSQILVINRVRVLGSGPHTPTQFFCESPPHPGLVVPEIYYMLYIFWL